MSNEIVKYLKYLRDVSRKIGTRANFENIYLRSSKKRRSRQNFTVIQLQNNFLQNTRVNQQNRLFSSLKLIYNYLERNTDKKLFIGLGTICGMPKIAGPLMFAECKLDDEITSLSLEIDISTLVINYDLIAKIIENKMGELLDEDDFYVSIEKESAVINLIEKKLEVVSFDENINDLGKLTEEVFLLLKEGLNEFKEIDFLYNYKYNYEQEISKYVKGKEREKSIFNLGSLVFLNVNHLFIASIPNEISTYQALTKLIEEIKYEGDFKNRLLDKILSSAFSRDILKIRYDEKSEEQAKEVLNTYLPIELSKSQKEALCKAFSYEISYVQGPPGTGKSHTLSAIILAAILLGKKVLVVSQKVPAVKVIKEKVFPYLQFDSSVLPAIYFDRNIKQELRSSIKNLLNKYSSNHIISQELGEIENKIVDIDLQIRAILRELDDLYQELEKNLEIQRKFVILSRDFVQFRKYFEEQYFSLHSGVPTLNKEILSKFKFILKNLKLLEKELPLGNRMQYIFVLNLIANTLKYFPVLKKSFLIEALKSGFLRHLLNDLLALADKYRELCNLRRNLKLVTFLLRKEISLLKSKLQLLQTEYINNVNKKKVLSLLGHYDVYQELNKFAGLLYFKKASRLKHLQKKIEWERILDIFPIWISEIRHLNEILPMKSELFDLILVDEASQVNLAEIIPVFYRGKSVCIVGDHNQLSLSSTGLNFQLSVNLDRLTWQKYRPNNVTYVDARRRNLTVTSASILDFIRSEENSFNITETLLDEHFRSFPSLAGFTNTTFYDGKLKIMTETPDKVLTECFRPVKVSGYRSKDKTILKEATTVIRILKSLIENRKFQDVLLSHHVPKTFSIGIISMVRNQVELIKELLEELPEVYIDRHNIIAGTPEELQGHERDVMLFSLCLDKNSTKSVNFYQNKKRFNVATSRAKYFTFVVFADVPPNFVLVRNYFHYFGYDIDSTRKEIDGYSLLSCGWKENPNIYTSRFERFLYEAIKNYIRERSSYSQIIFFNQVTACGQKDLNYVLFNPGNDKYVVVEVEGLHNFDSNDNSYSQAFLERLDILERVGWNVLTIPYHKWWFSIFQSQSRTLELELKKFYNQLDNILLS